MNNCKYCSNLNSLVVDLNHNDVICINCGIAESNIPERFCITSGTLYLNEEKLDLEWKKAEEMVGLSRRYFVEAKQIFDRQQLKYISPVLKTMIATCILVQRSHGNYVNISEIEQLSGYTHLEELVEQICKSTHYINNKEPTQNLPYIVSLLGFSIEYKRIFKEAYERALIKEENRAMDHQMLLASVVYQVYKAHVSKSKWRLTIEDIAKIMNVPVDQFRNHIFNHVECI